MRELILRHFLVHMLKVYFILLIIFALQNRK